MQALELLQGTKAALSLNRSGLATRARLAGQIAASGRTAVLVAKDRTSFSQLQALACLYTPSLSCEDCKIGQPAWEQDVVLLPQGLLVRDDNLDWAQRLSALYALSKPGPHLVVASVESLLVRWPARNFFLQGAIALEKGADLDQELLLEQLVSFGYTRTTFVARAGEMARRGDIVDIFAPGLRFPLRLEFFGDTLEDMRLFDADSQRSLEHLQSMTILPAKPYFQHAEGLHAMQARTEALLKDGIISEDIAYDCIKALEQGGSTLLPGSVLEGCTDLTDWLPCDSVYLCDGEQDTRESFLECAAELAGRLYGDAAPVLQSTDLCLRKADALPWEGIRESRAIYAEPLAVGIEEDGLCLQERTIRSFQELFPASDAMDRPWQHVSSLVREWSRSKSQLLLSFPSARSRQRFLKLAEQDGIACKLRYDSAEPGLYALISPFRSGAELVWDNSCILGEKVLFPKAEKTQRVSARAFKGMDSFEDIAEGELLVHRDYGIGRYLGLKSVETNGVSHDFLLMEYQGHDMLYVPVDRLALVQRFRSTEGSAAPSLDRLGTVAWNNCRDRARKAVEKIAADLIEMYAYRKVAKGYHYAPCDELYHEFEASFPYEETPDQARAIEDILRDMDKNVPMDRLVCGDVGFGKTEVAMRAAFRAATNGRQVALLCPTTVLAEQHYQTFRARMNGFPVRVGLLSRFVSHSKQRATIEAAERGEIDILIGTHRILSHDVVLPNLGLLILDEEQRFGVRHKEAMKEMRKNVDVLTLTATPIPRTLQLSMSGIRDLSLIETPPRERMPVQTAVIERDDKLLKEVVQRELDRNGQVFWVYNRVQGLLNVRDYVQGLVPEARVAVAHGQMNENDVEDAMRKFWHGEVDVLVCTSIVESGLDFPGANTLIVDQAQQFGLGQLYQLRGRVGRSDRQAFAYFVVPDVTHMTDIAEERLRILQDMDFLGAGFRVAMEDLRLRGAGNILGEAQTGQMTRVGLDLYLEMLEQAVERLKGTGPEKDVTCEINIGIAARIPTFYITDSQERLRQYRALTSAASGSERESIALELKDRFGAFPEDFQTFLAVLDFKQFLGSIQVEKADLAASRIKLSWAEGQDAVDPIKIIGLMQQTPGAQMVPPATLILPVAKDKAYSDVLSGMRSVLEGLRLEKTGDGEKAKEAAVVLISHATARAGSTGAPRDLRKARSFSVSGKKKA